MQKRYVYRSPKRSSSPLPAPPKIAPIKEKDYYKEDKKEKDDKRDKKEEKKPKKDKRDHKDKHKDRDKEKEYKEHKNKESKLTKDIQSFKSKDASPITVPQAGPQVVNKVSIFLLYVKLYSNFTSYSTYNTCNVTFRNVFYDICKNYVIHNTKTCLNCGIIL